MFRAGSELWAVYNLKHAHGGLQRSKQEESMYAHLAARGASLTTRDPNLGLEQLLYWTCMKAEWFAPAPNPTRANTCRMRC